MKKILAVVLTLLMTGILIGTVIVPAVAQGGGADIPNTIGYQGYLTDSGGVPIQTPVDMTFALYPVVIGGSPVWAEVHLGIQPNQGLFSVELGGSGSPVYTSDLDGERWLGVTVGGDEEMVPRQKYSSVAYSLLADEANLAYDLDITPSDPIHVGAITDDGTTALDGANSIWISGQYAYIASHTDDGVEVLDISDPSNPTHVGAIIDDGITALDGANDIYVSGIYAYVTSATEDGVEILDISDPANPTHVGAIFDNGTTALEGASGIYVSGNYAYVASIYDDGVEILDISDPANPSHVGAITDNATTELRGARGIYVSGKYAYVTGWDDDGVEIIDISDPSNPTHAGAITNDATNALYKAYGIYVSGNYAYVTGQWDCGVEILDISDPANPTHVGAIFDDATTVLDNANGIYVSGKYAYVTSPTENGVEVLDISDPANPTHVGAITDNGTTELDWAKDIYVSGKYAYVVSSVDDGLEILDIGGIDAPAANIGNIAASSIDVHDTVKAASFVGDGNSLTIDDPKKVIGDFVVASGSDVTAGDIVSFLDGYVNTYTSSGTPTFGSDLEFSSANTVHFSTAALSDTKFVVAYQDQNNSSYGTAIIGEVSGTTITYGSAYVFNSADTQFISVGTLSDTKFVVAYWNVAVPYHGTAIIGNVSGTTITYGSGAVFNSDSTVNISTTVLSDTKFVATYLDVGASDYGTAVIGNISGTTITFGSEYVFNLADTAYISATTLSDNRFIVAYQDAGNSWYGTAIMGNVTGTTINFGTEYVFNPAYTEFISATSLKNTKFVATYLDVGNSDYGTAVIGNISGPNITFGSEYVFNSADTESISATALSDTKFAIAFTDVVNSAYGTLLVGDVFGTDIIYGSEWVFNPAYTQYISLAHLSGGKLVAAYRDVGNSFYGMAIIGDVELSGRILGIAGKSKSAGQNIPVIMGGISDVHTNLLPGAVYYCDMSGNLTNTHTGYGMGFAISSTELVLDIERGLWN